MYANQQPKPSGLMREAKQAFVDHKLDELPPALRRNSLKHVFPSMYPVMSQLDDIDPDHPELEPGYGTSEEALYVHVPFCSAVCSFCSYYVTASEASDPQTYEDYFGRVMREVERHSERTALDLSFVVFGGGTPSLVPPVILDRFLTTMKDKGWARKETFGSFEFHPEIFEDRGRLQELTDVLVKHGITRVNVGYQSSDESVLDSSNRRHGRSFLENAMGFLRDNGMTINIDTIYGLPGLTHEKWEETLEQVIQAHPDSLTAYYMYLAPGTLDYRKVQEGSIVLPDFEYAQTQHIMAQLAIERAGYVEQQSDYFVDPKGLNPDTYVTELLPSESARLTAGAGSYGYRDGVQFSNFFNHREYSKRIDAGQTPIWKARRLTDEQKFRRDTMFSIKYRDYMNVRRFREVYGSAPQEVFPEIFARLSELGLLVVAEDTITPTRKGRLCVEEMVSQFIHDPDLPDGEVGTLVELKFRNLPSYDSLGDRP